MVAHLATSYDFPLSVYCSHSPDDAIQFERMQLEQAFNACETNRAVAMRLGLHSIAAMWSSLSALIPRRLSKPHPYSGESSSSVILMGVESKSSANFPFVLEILSSLLLDFLEGGDVLHVVVVCEVLRSSGMLDAVVSSSKTAAVRIRQAYMAYIRLLKSFQLFSLATEIISVSTGTVYPNSKYMYVCVYVFFSICCIYECMCMHVRLFACTVLCVLVACMYVFVLNSSFYSSIFLMCLMRCICTYNNALDIRSLV